MNQPIVTNKSIYQKSPAIKYGSSFYVIYVKPLIKQLKLFKKLYPEEWTARVYLAADLEFLVPQLLLPGVEVYVMHSKSLAAAPGSLWRFLVFQDKTVKAAYVKDADGGSARWDGDFSMTNKVLKWIYSPKTKGFFRVRDLNYYVTAWRSRNKHYSRYYSPISAASFGGKNFHWLNIEKAMKGFILHRILFPHEKRHSYDFSSKKHPYGFGNDYMGYGFDERFLKRVIYFAAADRNELTLLPLWKLPNNLHPNNLVRLQYRIYTLQDILNLKSGKNYRSVLIIIKRLAVAKIPDQKG